MALVTLSADYQSFKNEFRVRRFELLIALDISDLLKKRH